MSINKKPFFFSEVVTYNKRARPGISNLPNQGQGNLSCNAKRNASGMVNELKSELSLT
jgi:hypothetical protein